MGMPNLKQDWTVAERDALPDDGNRYEVIDGELFVTPAPAWRHQAAVGLVLRLLAEYLERQPVGYVFVAPADVVFSPKRGVQPDLFVVPLVDGRVPKHFDEVRHLLLAIEVLSPTTARADRVKKRTLFREEGVDEYWIVDLDARVIERSTPDAPRPEILNETLIWRPIGAAEPLVIDLESFFAQMIGE